jgi:hypothetical protein
LPLRFQAPPKLFPEAHSLMLTRMGFSLGYAFLALRAVGRASTDAPTRSPGTNP